MQIDGLAIPHNHYPTYQKTLTGLIKFKDQLNKKTAEVAMPFQQWKCYNQESV